MIVAFIGVSVAAALLNRSAGLDADLVTDRALSGLADLSGLRAALDRLEVDLASYASAPGRDERSQTAGLADDRRSIHGRLARCAPLVESAEARYLFAVVNERTGSVCHGLDDALAAVERGELAVAERSVRETRQESQRASDAVSRLMAFSGRQAEQLALDVRTARAKSIRLTFLLHGLVALLAAVIAVVAATGLRETVRTIQASQLVAEQRAVVLQERSSELEIYAGQVAHDILSPLDAVGIGLHLSKQRLAADADGVATIDRSARSLTRIQATVRDLLEVARSSANPTPGAAADLRRGIEGVMDDLAAEAHRAEVQIAVEPFADCRIACSSGVLSSLLGNLVHNAIKYMGHSPRRCVTLRAAETENGVRVEVEDTGRGVPEDMRTRIFEPFVRSEWGAVPGTGLGLAIVRKLARCHGGDAGCRSSLGVGSVFWFELPPARGEAADEPVREAGEVATTRESFAPARRSSAAESANPS